MTSTFLDRFDRLRWKPLIESNKVTATATVSCQLGGGASRTSRGVGVVANSQTVLPNFAKSCMKMKEFGQKGGRAPLALLLDQPLVSAVV